MSTILLCVFLFSFVTCIFSCCFFQIVLFSSVKVQSLIAAIILCLAFVRNSVGCNMCYEAQNVSRLKWYGAYSFTYLSEFGPFLWVNRTQIFVFISRQDLFSEVKGRSTTLSLTRCSVSTGWVKKGKLIKIERNVPDVQFFLLQVQALTLPDCKW